MALSFGYGMTVVLFTNEFLDVLSYVQLLMVLVLLQKKYLYTWKNIAKKPNLDEFLLKHFVQYCIQNCGNFPLLPVVLLLFLFGYLHFGFVTYLCYIDVVTLRSIKTSVVT